jgi:hypothetical protein
MCVAEEMGIKNNSNFCVEFKMHIFLPNLKFRDQGLQESKLIIIITSVTNLCTSE